ncbi:cytochrome P450 [Hypoxylon trugodes]|uniref:cytochrome P450 n=1 Tax=Hypoxylon trugodes TaxID=326681 RepID=UPI0021963C0B|nr:cytochrome P450 [Hypoxylon trugodes]KAI1386129.1 cytochrome P450 [Hypoxylon trugodes]
MLTNINLPYIALAVGSVIFLYFILAPTNPKKDEPWNKLDKIGVSSGFLPWTRATFASCTALLRNTHEGYHQFCKKGLPFALPTMWTGKAIVVAPISALHLTNKPDSELIGYWALVENIQLPYFIPDRNVLEHVIHFEVSRKDLTKRNVNRQLTPTAEELDNCFSTMLGNSTEWTTVNGWDMCGQIIARVALRTLLGFPTCRDEELVKTAQHFANNLFTAAAIINCTPPVLRPILAPVLALPTKRYRNRYREIVVPVIKERISLWEKHQNTGDGELPSDFLQWLIARAAQHGPEHMDASTISYRLLALNTMFVYAMSFIFAQTVIDICSSPDHKRFMDGMASECKDVFGRYPGGLASDDALEQLHRVDSAIRESMRISDVSPLSLPRDVVGNTPLDLGGGIVCPPGTRLMYPSQPIHMDPDFWENPLHFNAFRFSDPFDKEAEGSPPTQSDGTPKERENLVDLTSTFLAWGYGKKACPGRWYAGQTIKQSLAYMVINYEVELIGKPPKRRALLNAMIPPTGARLRFRRRVW